MTSWITKLLALGLAAAATIAAGAQPVIVGAVVSQSGAQASLAADYRKALLLWRDEVNAAGGLLGRPVELRLLDDGSHAVRAGPLYAELIRDHKADLLIGPYGSAATLLAAAEAERSRRVMVNGAGAASTVHKRSPQYVFQSAIPYSAYGEGVLELARSAGCRQLFILANDNAAAAEMAGAAHAAARSQGFSAGQAETYSGGTAGFTVALEKARAAGADCWIAFGGARDAAEMVKTFKKAGYAPRLFFASGSTRRNFIELVGQDAEFTLGVMEYDARFATPGNAQFARAFAARWSARPGRAAAEGYAAATVLAEAVRRAGALDQHKLRSALAALEIDTVLGAYRVNPANGAQVGMKPAVTQIVEGRPQIVSSATLQPYPRWNERRLLK